MAEQRTGDGVPARFDWLLTELIEWLATHAKISEKTLAEKTKELTKEDNKKNKKKGISSSALNQWKKGTKPSNLSDVEDVLRAAATLVDERNHGAQHGKIAIPPHLKSSKLLAAYQWWVPVWRMPACVVSDMAELTLGATSLGVHRAIAPPSVGEARDARAGSPLLPEFLPRNHDKHVRSALAQIKASERPSRTLVVLIGGSSTGKSRSALEAVCAELRGWSLLAPRTVDELLALLRGRRIVRDTVLWLDELQTFLGTGSSRQEAALRLQELLIDPRPSTQGVAAGRLGIIGSMWGEHWAKSAKSLGALGEEALEYSRALLRLDTPPPASPGKPVQVIRVPDEFTGQDLARATELARKDPQWKAILAIAPPVDKATGGRQLAQAAAGAPQLLHWWSQDATPQQAAIVAAAIDTTRLGCRRPLTKRSLERAAAGYLGDDERPEEWFSMACTALEAMHEATAGAAAPLLQIALPTAEGEIHGYMAADCLVQDALPRAGQRACPPDTLWTELIEWAAHDPTDSSRVQRVAKDRGLYVQAGAIALATAFQHPDDTRALFLLEDVLDLTSHPKEIAAQWWDWATATGHTPDIDPLREPDVELARHLERQDLDEQPLDDTSQQTAQGALGTGDTATMRQAANELLSRDNPETAHILLRVADAIDAAQNLAADIARLVNQSQPQILQYLVVTRIAPHLLDSAARQPDIPALDEAISRWDELCARNGLAALGEALALYDMPGGPQIFFRLATQLMMEVVRTLAGALENSGRHTDAERVWRDAHRLAAGTSGGLATYLDSVGRVAEADQTLHTAILAGDPDAPRQLAWLRVLRVDMLDEAITTCQLIAGTDTAVSQADPDKATPQNVAEAIRWRGHLDSASRYLTEGTRELARTLADLVGAPRATPTTETARQLLPLLQEQRRDRIDQAIRTWQDIAEDGAVHDPVAKIENINRDFPTLAPWPTGGRPAACELADLLRRAASYPDTPPAHAAAFLDQAERVMCARARTGDPQTARALVDLLTQRARSRKQIEDTLREFLAAGVPHALPILIDYLNSTGHPDEAGRINRYGIKLDGATAEKWRITEPPKLTRRQRSRLRRVRRRERLRNDFWGLHHLVRDARDPESDFNIIGPTRTNDDTGGRIMSNGLKAGLRFFLTLWALSFGLGTVMTVPALEKLRGTPWPLGLSLALAFTDGALWVVSERITLHRLCGERASDAIKLIATARHHHLERAVKNLYRGQRRTFRRDFTPLAILVNFGLLLLLKSTTTVETALLLVPAAAVTLANLWHPVWKRMSPAKHESRTK